jgi:hypothetical protein
MNRIDDMAAMNTDKAPVIKTGCQCRHGHGDEQTSVIDEMDRAVTPYRFQTGNIRSFDLPESAGVRNKQRFIPAGRLLVCTQLFEMLHDFLFRSFYFQYGGKGLSTG